MIETQKADTYLSALHNHLSPMTLGERDEIIREISAHIRDSAESGVNLETVLSRLGPAEQLAAKYRDVLLIRQASQSISPVQLLRGAQRLATKGISGILVFVAGMFGYIIGGGLVLTGLMKPVFPGHTGVWFQNGRVIACGTIFPLPQGHEVLGIWYIPVMLTAGSLTLLATTFVIQKSLRISQHWQAKLSRGE